MPTDPATQSSHPSGSTALTTLLLCALLALVGLFPPETRGESWIGCSLLIALVVVLHWRSSLPDCTRWLLLAGVLALWTLSWIAVAPGEAVGPALAFVLAAVLGLHVAGLPQRLRVAPAVPWTLAITGGATALYGLVQVVWGLQADAALLERVADLVPDQREVLVRLSRGRAFAAFPTPAALGGYLAITLPTTVALTRSLGGRRRAAGAVLALLQGAGLLATVSLTAVGALSVGALSLLLARGRHRRALLLVTLAGALAVGALLVLRADVLLDPGHERNPLRLRAGNFRIAGEIARDHPWLGVGLGGYGEVFPAYRRVGDNEARYVHDLPLQMLAELGLPLGLLAAGGFLAIFLAPALRAGGRGPPWHAGLAVGLAAFAFHNLVDFTAYLPSLMWTAALGRGLLARGDSQPQPRRAAGAALAVLVVTLAAALGGVRLGFAANAGYQARILALAGGAEAALERAERAARWAPWDADWPLFGAQAALDLGDAERAGDLAERAVELAPCRPVARAVRARVRLLAGDPAGAFSDLTRAAALYPAQRSYARARDDLRERLPGNDYPAADRPR